MARRPPWLAAALEHQLAGRFAEAERIYAGILRAVPDEADALNLLGLIAAYRKDYGKAEASISRAVALRPGRGDFHAALGNVFLAQGADAGMTECYRRALALEYFAEIPASFAELAARAGSEPAQTDRTPDIGLYRSQYLQDVFLDRWVFGCEREGVFVDVGAHDGVTYSNSYFFERARGWTGLCIEPNPSAFARLAANRRCTLLDCCVSARAGTVAFQKISGHAEMLSGIAGSYHPGHRERIERELKRFGGTAEPIEVPARNLGDIAGEYGLASIDYLSLDTEGSEYEILRSIDFGRLFVHALTVECNFEDGRANMVSSMEANGFELAIALGHDLLFLNRASPRHTAHAKLRRNRL